MGEEVSLREIRTEKLFIHFLTAVEGAGIMKSCKADHNEVVVAGVHSVLRDLKAKPPWHSNNTQDPTEQQY
jgi:hypothetical protein